MQTLDESLSEAEALIQPQQWLNTQAALHDPNQLAGGHADRVTDMGNARVNSSIGAQWPKRIKEIDNQICQYATQPSVQQQATTYLNIELPMA